jgi:hypothetical protein
MKYNGSIMHKIKLGISQEKKLLYQEQMLKTEFLVHNY